MLSNIWSHKSGHLLVWHRMETECVLLHYIKYARIHGALPWVVLAPPTPGLCVQSCWSQPACPIMDHGLWWGCVVVCCRGDVGSETGVAIYLPGHVCGGWGWTANDACLDRGHAHRWLYTDPGDSAHTIPPGQPYNSCSYTLLHTLALPALCFIISEYLLLVAMATGFYIKWLWAGSPHGREMMMYTPLPCRRAARQPSGKSIDSG